MIFAFKPSTLREIPQGKILPDPVTLGYIINRDQLLYFIILNLYIDCHDLRINYQISI